MTTTKMQAPPSFARMPDEFQDLKVIDKHGNTAPEATLTNARIALHLLGARCSHNLFNGKKYAAGIQVSSDVQGQLTDEVVTMLRLMVREHFGFDPGINNMWQAVNVFCREHAYHPIKDYLESLEWDGTPRIATMLRDYFHAPDTPFVRGVSEMVMVASVRRIYQPGEKFDYMTVLESTEGENKSSALAALYGRENFSDQTILGLDDKQLAEAVRGRWCIESADLSGMRKADVEKVKAQLSRFEDRTRPAYGRAVIEAPRSCIFWGTTNEREYLRSQTGNRRFLPVPVGRIDVQAILRERDQLWAEAAAVEPLTASIMLPEALWGDAATEQAARTKVDMWSDATATISEQAAWYERDKARGAPVVYEQRDDHKRGIRVERVATSWVLTHVLGIPVRDHAPDVTARLGMVLRSQGWHGPETTLRIGGKPVRGYWREIM